MNGQRFVALVLSMLFVLVILTAFYWLFNTFGHPGWGLATGLVFVVIAVLGFVRDARQRPR